MIKGLSVVNPSLKNVLENVRAEVFQTLNCVKIGTIVSFDADNRTAEIQISFKRELSIPLSDGTQVVSYPLLVDCPVFTLQGGAGGMKVPVAAGDECLVLFSDSNIDAWYENGGEALPLDGRRDDLSDGIAVVGLNSLAKPLALAVEDDETGLGDSLAKVAVKNGKINLSNATMDFKMAMDTFLTACACSTTDPVLASAAATLKTSLALLLY